MRFFLSKKTVIINYEIINKKNDYYSIICYVIFCLCDLSNFRANVLLESNVTFILLLFLK